MSDEISLDGLKMHVSGTDATGVVGADTVLEFHQHGSTVWAQYAGGDVEIGFLAGTLQGSELDFRYTQVERSGDVHGGHSRCDVERLSNGRIRFHEHSQWD